MFLSYSSFALCCLGVAVAWFWQDSLRARDSANAAAMAACERIGLQFLDGTAAFAKLRLTRVEGRLRLRRTYVFDYTSQSIERRQGFAIMVGHEVEYVGFAPEHTSRAGTPISAAPIIECAREHSDSTDQTTTGAMDPQTVEPPNNVLDLNEHRSRRSLAPENAAKALPKTDRFN